MLYASRLFDGVRFHDHCRVTVHDGRLTAIDTGVEPQTGDQELDVGFLAPGLIDLQINGYLGVDFANADSHGFATSLGQLARMGTTSCLPTIITAPVEDLLASLDRIAAAQDTCGTRILGAHVEGPFISVRRKGAHRAEIMRDPSDDVLEPFLRHPLMALMTLAPERPGGMAAIARLAAAGKVASIGHSDATGTQVHEAAACGARMVTHLFNAQRPIGHKEPGVPGAALVDDRLTLGLIADLHHVTADMVRLAFAAAAERIVLVTDALASAGMPAGTYELGGESVVIDEVGGPARRLDGTLSGSGLTMAAAVRNCVSIGVPLDGALRAATVTPADVLGRADVGRLQPGALADMVWFDDSLSARRVWMSGTEVTGSA
jgi:N-acetylglucosamine-6-phosphate deacetylase